MTHSSSRPSHMFLSLSFLLFCPSRVLPLSHPSPLVPLFSVSLSLSLSLCFSFFLSHSSFRKHSCDTGEYYEDVDSGETTWTLPSGTLVDEGDGVVTVEFEGEDDGEGSHKGSYLGYAIEEEEAGGEGGEGDRLNSCELDDDEGTGAASPPGMARKSANVLPGVGVTHVTLEVSDGRRDSL